MLFRSYFVNDNDALIPEHWAQESIAILEENMVVSRMVHRDFENELASFGDIVNTRKPGELKAKRKSDADDVTVQDVSSTNVQVPLNHHVHVSFTIKDGEQSKSFKDLVQFYMKPAMLAQARYVDQMVLGQYPQFLAYTGGQLGGLTSSNGLGYILDVRNKLNQNKVYMDGRNMILTPNTETNLLKLDLFTHADKLGDDGSALREASLGRKMGYNFFMCQNMSDIAVGNTTVTGAINNAAGYPAGTTTFTVDGFAAAIANGSWFSLGGVAYQVVSTVGGAVPTSITIAAPGLRDAVADNAVITIYTPGAVNNAAGYAAGWYKEIVVDAFTVAPRVGQFVTFGTATTKYTVIDVNGLVGITLDRPLEAAIVDNAGVNIGPAGSYNLAFHRNAIALVVRPLALPASGVGARSSVINIGGLSVRATIAYEARSQGHLVTLDMLCGVKVLDTLLGAVMLA